MSDVAQADLVGLQLCRVRCVVQELWRRGHRHIDNGKLHRDSLSYTPSTRGGLCCRRSNPSGATLSCLTANVDPALVLSPPIQRPDLAPYRSCPPDDESSDMVNGCCCISTNGHDGRIRSLQGSSAPRSMRSSAYTPPSTRQQETRVLSSDTDLDDSTYIAETSIDFGNSLRSGAVSRQTAEAGAACTHGGGH